MFELKAVTPPFTDGSAGIFRGIKPLILLMAIWYAATFATGCANIQAPIGGKKDTIPPVLVKVVPDENTLHFKGNTLRFAFDEYITLGNLNENLVINPPQDKFPAISSKLRNMTVKLLDTLLPNTTYTINFGNAVKDVNEGNPLKNFSYSFSTGDYIDSLELAGKMVDAETGLPDSTMIVMLHMTEADSAVAKKKPSFVTRVNSRGVFRFDHLPTGKFYIFGIRDEGAKRYTNPQTPFAFYDTTVTAGSADSVMLRFFAAEKEPEKKRPAASGSGITGRNEKKKDDKKLSYSNTASQGQDLLGPLDIVFLHKISAFDSSKIRLTDTLYKPAGAYSLTLDSTGTKISVTFKWKDDENYRLILQKGFAHDSAGVTTLKSDTIRFKTKSESDYGSLKLTFAGVDTRKNPVIQFVENTGTKIVFSAPLSGTEYNNKLFQPGQYKIRILYDINKNGKWDTGNYWKKLQPELVIPVQQTLNVKANWDNEVEIRL